MKKGRHRAWRKEESCSPLPAMPRTELPLFPGPDGTYVLKQGSPDSRNIPMVTYGQRGEISSSHLHQAQAWLPGHNEPISCVDGMEPAACLVE
jgi:hypothetical protein